MAPARNSVHQRGAAGTADIEILGTAEGSGQVQVRIGGAGYDTGWLDVPLKSGSFEFTVKGVPCGGPYTVEARKGGSAARVRDVLVGDIWIMGGQSNMDGCARMERLEPPHRMVHAYYYREEWDVARDPLCILNESIDPVHWGTQDEAERRELARAARETPEIGAGLGVRFGKDIYRATKVPIGLIPCSHGGTSMEQWDPALKTEGGYSLYGSLLRRVHAVGGKVAGCIWYQGESNACGPDAGESFHKRFREFISILRRDLNHPDLPFLCVQLGPLYGDESIVREGWNRVQLDQLEVESEVPHALMAAAIDSTLSDFIHVDAVSQRRIGARLAKLALRERYGLDLEAGPRPVEGVLDPNRRKVTLSFRGVNGRLRPEKGIRGFSVEAGKEVLPVAQSRLTADGRGVEMDLESPAPQGALLWHGRGIAPAVNLRDAEGLFVPVFRVPLRAAGRRED